MGLKVHSLNYVPLHFVQRTEVLLGQSMSYVVTNLMVSASAPDPAWPPQEPSKNPEYYIAQEIATTYTGMLIAVPEDDWTVFTEASPPELSGILLNLARRVALAKFKKNKRGPKKASNPRTQFKGKTHVSTAKLVAATASR